jgi:hypothetical protein
LNTRKCLECFPGNTVVTGNNKKILEKVREDSGKSQNFFLVMTEFFPNKDSSFFRKEIENHATLGICFWFFSVAIFPAEVFEMEIHVSIHFFLFLYHHL